MKIRDMEIATRQTWQRLEEVLRQRNFKLEPQYLSNATMQFGVNDISRLAVDICSGSQFGSPSCRSQRYITENKEVRYYTPEEISRDCKLRKEYESLISSMIDTYSVFIRGGINKEDARAILPMAVHSSMFLTLNGTEILDFFKLCSYSDDSELYSLGSKIHQEVSEKYPVISEQIRVLSSAPVRKPEIEKLLENFLTETKIISHSENPVLVCGNAAATCYKKDPNKRLDFDESKDLISEKIKPSGHTSVLEHAFFDIYTMLPAYIIQQLARHRLVSLKKEGYDGFASKDRIHVPDSFKTSEVINNYIESAEKAISFYKQLRESEISDTESARVLPYGLKRKVKMTVNVSELIHILSLRTCARTQKEFRDFAYTISIQALENWQPLFEGIGPNCHSKGKCFETNPCEDGNLKQRKGYLEFYEKVNSKVRHLL